MSEVTDLTVLEIKPEQAPALYVANGLDSYLEVIREMAKEVPDVTTKKGRDRIGSLARMVGSSKKAIENPGRAYLKKLKEAVKPAEAELKRFVDECDDISKGILKPRAEWEAEQERIAAEKAAEEERLRVEAEQKAALEALKKEIEVKHEMALLLNEKFDRDLAEAKAEAERQRISHEEELKRQAAEQARLDAKAAAEAAERQRIETQQKAEREAKEAAERAERDRVEAQQRAEREKQEAIAETQRKAQQEADRIKREAEAKEAARLAEEKRVADEKARREADTENRKTINNQVIEILTKAGISPECAKECVIAIVKNQNQAIASGITPPVQINY